MTLSIMTLSIKVLFATLSITTLNHYACHYAECRILFILMANVVMLNVVMPNVVMLSVIMLGHDYPNNDRKIIVKSLVNSIFDCWSSCNQQRGVVVGAMEQRIFTFSLIKEGTTEKLLQFSCNWVFLLRSNRQKVQLNTDLLKQRHRFLYRRMRAQLKLNEIGSFFKWGTFNKGVIFERAAKEVCSEIFWEAWKFLQKFNEITKQFTMPLQSIYNKNLGFIEPKIKILNTTERFQQ